MFEEFSAGYYLGRLYVQPHDGDHAVIHRTDHERMNERLYTTGEGVERLDAPLVMKLDGKHFPVLGEEGVPSGTLGLPPSVTETDLPDRCEVFLAKPDRAAELLRYAGYGSDGVTDEAV
ncbi:DUF5802 family protein [Haloplanus pelagicus]|jgi:hypothetical protein|uniref:DUF5802 family protein n=1 Tax=Haloplanus pelagicus TaxID=2949995 RepID=UPI00203D6741|nr:DUF5802 family protein [Haloplanus sp. HW8-1]